MDSRIILFDLNGTLLDMKALDPEFSRAFGSHEARQTWFLILQEIALTSVVTGVYQDFTTLCRAALKMTAAKQRTTLSESACESILERMKRLPPYPEVRDGLKELRKAGYTLAVLTNSVLSSARTQVEHAGLTACFDHVLSADETKRLKPAPEPYHLAAERMGTITSQCWLVAAHAWDISGAAAAGCATAFLGRPGRVLNPAGPHPDVTGRNLTELADAIQDYDRKQHEELEAAGRSPAQ